VEFLNTAIKTSPSTLVLDMRMPGMSGLELLNALAELNWEIPVIYMSGESHTQEIIDAMKGGAVDFLWKPFSQTQLVDAIEKSLTLDAERSATKKRLTKVNELYQSLSRKEQHIFSLMLLGHGNKSIAAVTGVMPDTVKKHRAQVFEKMQVASLADLLALCKDFVPPQSEFIQT
jgi:FixJ family two-component response regulator